MLKTKRVYLIQHLAGYSGEEKYRKNETDFLRVGFIRCRSEPGPEDKGGVWEVWLGFPWHLKEELKDSSDAEILRWLTRRGPGEIAIAVEEQHWGLSPG